MTQEYTIISAEQHLKALRKQTLSMQEKIKEGEGYVQGISDALKAFGTGETLSAYIKVLMNIGSAINARSVEACDILEHSIRMAKNLQEENKILRELILTMLGLPPHVENDVIEERAKEFGEFISQLGEVVNRARRDGDALSGAVGR